MKERPILFQGPMVRAILDWRKTQTRREIKPQPEGPACVRALQYHAATGNLLLGGNCPYGTVGDRLWVRETWMTYEREDGLDGVLFRADAGFRQIENTPQAAAKWVAARHGVAGKWRPSIFMPRWASRITLEITSVRVERLQEISNEDCFAEGMWEETNPEVKCNRLWYSSLWETINGPGSWDKNPWVWVIEFLRL